ncbi:MAG: phosphate acyltransferase PlsX [Actinomycetota bacterium]
MESGKYSIVIDAMGGDYAPHEVIKGADKAASLDDVEVLLAGNRQKIEKAASELGISLDKMKIIEAGQEISMDQSPSYVLKHGKDSSIFKGTAAVAGLGSGAFLSAGNTGAVMACSLFNMKRIEGVLRPAIAVVIPIGIKNLVLLDAGANVDCKPQYLEQFALMGKIYAQNIIGLQDPAVGLLNIGSEEKKGNELTIEAYKLLKQADINFTGNVEGRDLFEGAVDIAICDGFIGNILLKSIEGLAGLLFSELKSVLTKNIINKLMALGLKKSLKGMKKKFDYEEYGGAYLLGINGITIISHGSSKEKAIYNAAKVAYGGIKADLVGKLKQEIKSKS